MFDEEREDDAEAIGICNACHHQQPIDLDTAHYFFYRWICENCNKYEVFELDDY